jgi:hypothetical protein
MKIMIKMKNKGNIEKDNKDNGKGKRKNKIYEKELEEKELMLFDDGFENYDKKMRLCI